MKSLDTIVVDIQDLLSKKDPSVFSEDWAKDLSEKLALRIRNKLSEERGTVYLRLSNIGGKCDRELWYGANRPDKGEPLPPEAELKFLYGDILEEVILALAKAAGHTVEGEQDEITVEGVVGHRDAIIDGVTVDVKSASSYSFNEFASGLSSDHDSFGYLGQLDAYIEGSQQDPRLLDRDSGAFLVVDKTLGKLTLDRHERQGIDYPKVVAEKTAMLASTKPPPRPFTAIPDGKSGNMKLDVKCSYCKFKQTCWPGLRTFIYSRGPVFLTEVKRVPDVREV